MEEGANVKSVLQLAQLNRAVYSKPYLKEEDAKVAKSGGIIQVSLDVTTLEEAMDLAHAAVRAGVDWLEAGTPLILAEGLRCVKAMREAFPDAPIVADLKTMDGAGLEAEMMFKAGANMTVVMGQAHDASIIEQVKMARQYGGKVMCDVMLCPDKPKRAREAQEMGVDYIIVHTGFDERNMIQGLSPLDDLDRFSMRSIFRGSSRRIDGRAGDPDAGLGAEIGLGARW